MIRAASWGAISGLLNLAACGGSAPEIAIESVVRTADPTARGLTEDDFPRVQELADGVFSYEALRSAGDERFTTVSMFVVTEAGVLVADGQGSLDATQGLIDAIARVTDVPIAHVVVCSDHGDHTAGNAAFPPGVEFWAHPTSAAVLEATAQRPGRSPDAPPVRLATRIVENHEVLTLGGREIHIRFLGRAHTGGDLVVHLPAERILFMSETYLNRVFPAMRSAYPSEWVAMIEAAQAFEAETYVPGHGFVETPVILAEELDTYKRALRRVIDEATRLHAAGVPLDAARDQATFGDLDTWTLRASQGPRAIQQVYRELNGALPNP